MKYQKTHHTPEQIIDKLQRAKQIVAEGGSVESACQALRIGLSTLYRWRKRYGEMTWRQARQLYEYEIENRRLKFRLTQKQCENLVLRSIVEGNL
jgi:putative transposase